MTELADEPTSLLDWVTGLATDPVLRARFTDEPRSVLDEQGLAGLTPADLHHALPLVSDSVAARLGADVDPAALTTTAAQLAGEDPASALARQLGVVTDSVLAGSAVAVAPGPGIDDDPVDLDDLDTPDGPGDGPDGLDDPDDLDGHHDLDAHHDLDGPEHPMATVTALPVPPAGDGHDDVDDADDGDAPGLVVGTPPEHPWTFHGDGQEDLVPDVDGPDGHADALPHPDPDDPGPDGADAEWFA